MVCNFIMENPTKVDEFWGYPGTAATFRFDPYFALVAPSCSQALLAGQGALVCHAGLGFHGIDHLSNQILLLVLICDVFFFWIMIIVF